MCVCVRACVRVCWACWRRDVRCASVVQGAFSVASLPLLPPVPPHQQHLRRFAALLIVIMSWPSFYGYKYTPIGLRQREMKDYTGTRTMNTTVHLPEGGHLLDIERKYSPDGTHSKKETASSVPSVFDDYARPAPPAPTPRGPAPLSPFEDYPSLSALERQADDIIANFRARQAAGLDEVDSSSSSAKAQAVDQITSSAEMSSVAAKASSSSSDYRSPCLFFSWGYEGDRHKRMVMPASA